MFPTAIGVPTSLQELSGRTSEMPIIHMDRPRFKPAFHNSIYTLPDQNKEAPISTVEARSSGAEGPVTMMCPNPLQLK